MDTNVKHQGKEGNDFRTFPEDSSRGHFTRAKLNHETPSRCPCRRRQQHFAKSAEQTYCRILLEAGYDMRTVQELLDHKHVETTMIYTHVVNLGVLAVRSPLDLVGA